MNTSAEQPQRRGRRAPTSLEPVRVVDVEERSPRLLHLRFAGEGLRGPILDLEAAPAASVRLLVPTPGDGGLVVPTWTGNEFLRPDGSRPILRTFTPLHHDPDRGALDLEIVRHPGGAVARWAENAGPGADAAIGGIGGGYDPDPAARSFLLLGDETALPAIGQLLRVLGGRPENRIHAHIEVVTPEAVIELHEAPGVRVDWHVRGGDEPPGTRLREVADAVEDLEPEARIWAAGEAASMQSLRKRFCGELGVDRARTNIRGYWKPERRSPPQG